MEVPGICCGQACDQDSNLCSLFFVTFEQVYVHRSVWTPVVLTLISQMQCETMKKQKESKSDNSFGKLIFESNAKNGLFCQITESPPKYFKEI